MLKFLTNETRELICMSLPKSVGKPEKAHLTAYLYSYPVDTGHNLNVHKTFRRRPGCLLNVLCTFNLRSVSTG